MIIGTGTEAVGAVLSITAYHILSSTARLRLLQQELYSVASSANTAILPNTLLKKCPYLTGCIKEGLRLSKESNRMPQVN